MVTGPLGREIDRSARLMYNGQPAGQSQGCAARLWPLRHRAASQNAPQKNVLPFNLGVYGAPEMSSIPFTSELATHGGEHCLAAEFIDS